MKKIIALTLFCIISVNIMSQNHAGIRIDGGKFKMGSNDSSVSSPVHTVKISSFYVSGDLVNRGEYEAVFGAPFSGDGETNYKLTNDMAALPATDVSWIRALIYCNEISKQEGLELYYEIPGEIWEPADIKINYKANGYRLLTEAEWEFLSQNKEEYEGVLNLDDTYYEWVWDGYIPYTPVDKINPVDESGSYDRVIRGGKYYERHQAPAADRHMYGEETGFRIARNS